MQHYKLSVKRSLSVLIALVFMIGSLGMSTESVSAASKLKISAAAKTIYVGETVKVTANKNVKWSLSNKAAKLTSSKKKSVVVKGLKAGTVSITAKAGKQTDKLKIKVKPLELKSSKKAIGVDEPCMITVKSETSSFANGKVAYTSSDPSIAEVTTNGLVMGKKVGDVIITGKSRSDSNLKAKIKLHVVKTSKGTVTISIDLSKSSKYPAGKTAKVWFPIPVSDDDQVITEEKIEAPDADKNATGFTYDSAGDKIAYVEWGTNVTPAKRTATITYHVYRKEVVCDDDLATKEKGTIDPRDFAEDLKETKWSGSLTEGIVKDTADGIVKKAKARTVYEKAYAIYDWVCENMYRDRTAPNGERADVVAILSGERRSNTCIDVHGVFVALCRAEGIPAKEAFGMKLADGGQNCRAQFYLPGYGWVYVDPALALKAIMNNEDAYRGKGASAENAATWKSLKDTYWGNGSETWIVNNYGRDIILDPPQSIVPKETLEVLDTDGTLNHFMFPYCEFDGQYYSGLGKSEYEYRFDYGVTFTEDEDCTC